MRYSLTYISSIFFFVTFYLFAFVSPVSAIEITEVYPQPTTSENEWIELYNPSDESVNLSSWYLEDLLSTPSIIYTFPEGSFLPAHSYLAVDLSSAKLNNSSDGVKLYTSSHVLKSEMSYNTSELSKSWSLLSDQTWQLLTPTKGLANPIIPPPSPTPLPSATPQPTPTATPITYFQSILELVSFLPCPVTGNPEALDLKNTSSSPITLTNWYVLDADDNKKLLSAEIPANQTTTLQWSGSFLNNTGDSLRIFTASDELFSQASYGECQRGLAFTLVAGSWQQVSVQESASELVSIQPNIADQTAATESSSSLLITNKQPTFQPPHLSLPLVELAQTTTTPIKAPLITFSKVPVSKEGVVSVIIGGGCISIAGCIYYYYVKPDKTSDFD